MHSYLLKSFLRSSTLLVFMSLVVDAGNCPPDSLGIELCQHFVESCNLNNTVGEVARQHCSNTCHSCEHEEVRYTPEENETLVFKLGFAIVCGFHNSTGPHTGFHMWQNISGANANGLQVGEGFIQVEYIPSENCHVQDSPEYCDYWVAQAIDLVQVHKVNAVFHFPLCSEREAEVLEIYHEAQVLQFSMLAISSSNASEYLFSLSTVHNPLISILKEAEQHNLHRLAIGYGNYLRETAMQELSLLQYEENLQLVRFQEYSMVPSWNITTKKFYYPDIDEFLLEIQDLEVDALAVMAWEERDYIMQKVEEMGLDFGIITFFHAPLHDMINSLGATANYLTTAVQWTQVLDTPCMTFGSNFQFIEDFRSIYGFIPEEFEAYGAAAGVVLQAALQRAGSMSISALMDQLLVMKVDTVMGPVKFSIDHNNIGRDSLVTQIQDGVVEIVEPAVLATAALIIPVPTWECRNLTASHAFNSGTKEDCPDEVFAVWRKCAWANNGRRLVANMTACLKREEEEYFQQPAQNTQNMVVFEQTQKEHKKAPLLYIIGGPIVIIVLLLSAIWTSTWYSSRTSSAWIKKCEVTPLLDMGGQPTIIGVSTFGIVTIEMFRGTKVAVKSLAPRNYNSMKFQRSRGSNYIEGFSQRTDSFLDYIPLQPVLPRPLPQLPPQPSNAVGMSSSISPHPLGHRTPSKSQSVSVPDPVPNHRRRPLSISSGSTDLQSEHDERFEKSPRNALSRRKFSSPNPFERLKTRGERKWSLPLPTPSLHFLSEMTSAVRSSPQWDLRRKSWQHNHNRLAEFELLFPADDCDHAEDRTNVKFMNKEDTILDIAGDPFNRSEDSRGSLDLIPDSRSEDVMAPVESSRRSMQSFNHSILKRSLESFGRVKSLFACNGLLRETRQMKEYEEEINALMKLRHPNIVTALAVYMDEERGCCVVMEQMGYGSLYDMLHSNTSVPLTSDLLTTLRILRDVCSGLQYLHETSPPMVHGDVRSGNVLLGHNLVAKLADFGLSLKRKLPGLVRGGNPLWMAPELLAHWSESLAGAGWETGGSTKGLRRLRSSNVSSGKSWRRSTSVDNRSSRRSGAPTPASDIYAFGIMVWELLTREEPYMRVLQQEDEAGESQSVLERIQHSGLRPEIPHEVPEDLQSLMNDCWKHQPGERPAIAEVSRRICLMVENLEQEVHSLEAEEKEEKTRRTQLLDQILPQHVALALSRGLKVEPESFDPVTIFFSDIVNFTDLSATLPPHKVMGMLDRLFTQFDSLCARARLFKVETIGDAYMCVGGLPHFQVDHTARVALFSLDIVEAANNTLVDLEDPNKGNVNIRVGFHSGPVVASVVGELNPRYCLFGDTVNFASRMESNSEKNKINTSRQGMRCLLSQARVEMEHRGVINIKGKGGIKCYFLKRSEQNRIILRQSLCDDPEHLGMDADHSFHSHQDSMTSYGGQSNCTDSFSN